ncbi:MAG: winged helix-turn-helix domain-containing protein [Acidobacteriota bacterium]
MPLTPKAFDVLVYLVARRGHLVGKEELMEAVWQDLFVEEGNLTRIINALRRALGEDDNGNKFIETVPTKGYRFVAKIEDPDESDAKLRRTESLTDPNAEIISNGAANYDGNRAHLTSVAVKRQFQLRLVFFLLIGLIAAVSVTGFWFAGGWSRTSSKAKGLTPETSNGVAYQHYQQGRLLLEKQVWAEAQNALLEFEKAIELDPNYASAYVGKADAKFWMFTISGSHGDISQYRAAIKKAIELDESNSYAHTLKCRILGTYDWDFSGAEKECRLALELDPNDPEALREWAFFLNVFGREDEAFAAMDKAIAIAPTSFNKRSRGLILYFSRRYDEAIAQLEQVEETDPEFLEAGKWLARSYEMNQNYAKALECYLRYKKLVDEASAEEIASIESEYEKAGWPGVLRTMTGPGGNDMNKAEAYAQLGDKDRAFEELERAFQGRKLRLILTARNPRLDLLRNDPRFDVLLARIGLR